MISSQTKHHKIELGSKDYIDMVGLYESCEKSSVKDYQNKYEEYSIIDSIIALEFFCNFMHEYHYELTQERVKTIPLTASSCSEIAFLK
jgi:hypothetical protein